MPRTRNVDFTDLRMLVPTDHVQAPVRVYNNEWDCWETVEARWDSENKVLRIWPDTYAVHQPSTNIDDYPLLPGQEN